MSMEMKDSGIDWIGEIPKHWNVTRLKFILHGNLQYGANESGVIYDESLPRYVRITDIQDNTLRDDITKLSLTEEQAKGYILKDNDILFARSGATVGKSFIYKKSYGKCAFAGYLIKASINNNNDARFIYHYTQGLSYDEWKKQVFIQATIQNIGADKYAQLPIPLPTKEEQSRIANFLDKKCAEIDELIVLQEQMIAQLNTYKQAVITEIVTKGLDPNVKMKDSGVEWIGEIPEHWDVCKIQYMANLKSGYNLTTEQITDEGLYPVYGGNGIRGFYHEFFNDGEYVLIGRQGALCGNINYSTGKFWATEHAVICYPKMQYATKWFGELLRSMNLNQYSLASVQPGLAVERIKALSIPLPPLSEQQSIAQYLDQKCKEIDELISIKKEKIEHLKAYKKSVIYEYVTGKKQVFDN